MDEKPKTYWQEIKPLWLSEIKSVLGWTGWLNALLRTGSLIIAFIFTFVVTGNFEDLVGSLVVELGKLLFFILSFFFVFMHTYVKASGNLNEEKNKTIKLLSDGLYQEPVIVKIDIEAVDTSLPEQNQFANIKVTSRENKRFNEFFARLEYAILLTENNASMNVPITEQLTHSGSFISWSGGDEHLIEEMVKGNPVYLNVAEIVGQDLVFRMKKANIIHNTNRTFKLGIVFGGTWDNREMQEIKKCYYMEYAKFFEFPSASASNVDGSRMVINDIGNYKRVLDKKHWVKLHIEEIEES